MRLDSLRDVSFVCYSYGWRLLHLYVVFAVGDMLHLYVIFAAGGFFILLFMCIYIGQEVHISIMIGVIRKGMGLDRYDIVLK